MLIILVRFLQTIITVIIETNTIASFAATLTNHVIVMVLKIGTLH